LLPLPEHTPFGRAETGKLILGRRHPAHVRSARTFIAQSDRKNANGQMDTPSLDTPMRLAAFEHIRRLNEVHDHLTAAELKPGFVFRQERIPLINPQRGIFKPQQMRFLLTVFPKPGGKVWYNDQREVHRQIFQGDETIDYAFMGQNPDAADNRWLREAFENQIPVIYFLGIAPGRYQAVLPTFISGWDGQALKVRVTFGPNPETLVPPADSPERRYALRTVKQRLHQATFREAVITAYDGRCAKADPIAPRCHSNAGKLPKDALACKGGHQHLAIGLKSSDWAPATVPARSGTRFPRAPDTIRKIRKQIWRAAS
jgi:hypothetical protein